MMLLAAGCGDDDSLRIADWTFIDGEVRRPIHLPTHVDELLSTRGAGYRLVTTVDVPAPWRGKPLTLAFTRLPTLVALEVDGNPVESAASGLFRGYRSPGAQQWRIPGALTEADTLPLSLSVRDTWFQSSWIASTPALSPHPDGDRWYRSVTTFNTTTSAMALAVLLLLTLSYTQIFLGDRSRHDYGWFAAQGGSAASYPLFVLGGSQLLFGHSDRWLIGFTAIAAIVSVGYSYSHFGLTRSMRPWLGLALVVIAVTVLGSGPFTTGQVLAPLVVATIAVVAIYQVYLTAQLLKRGTRRGDAATQLAAWVLLTLFAGPDFLYWLGYGDWLEGLSGGSLGIALYATLQLTALGRDHTRVLYEVDAANAELRRQIAARSRQLSHALARLGQPIAQSAELSPGMVVEDRYRVVRRLGDGAMAVVYRVERIEDGVPLALKVLRSVSDANVLARFAREAHIAAEVSHPNVVAIHDIDFASAGFMYVAMELVDGPSLRASSDRYGDVRWALEVLLQICRGLEALHERGVVHRDLKPANILLTGSDEALVVKIADFGVSGRLETTAVPQIAKRAALEEATVTGRLANVTGPTVAEATSPPGRDPELTSSVVLPVGAELAGWFEDNARTTGVDSVERTRDVVADTSGDVPELTRNFQARASIDAPHLTQAGHILGTPAYMAPEILQGGGKEPARDIYSLGIIAFELFTGTRPYPKPPLLCRISGAPAPAPASLGTLMPQLDPELIGLVDAAIGFIPEKRPSLDHLIACVIRCQRASARRRGGASR